MNGKNPSPHDRKAQALAVGNRQIRLSVSDMAALKRAPADAWIARIMASHLCRHAFDKDPDDTEPVVVTPTALAAFDLSSRQWLRHRPADPTTLEPTGYDPGETFGRINGCTPAQALMALRAVPSTIRPQNLLRVALVVDTLQADAGRTTGYAGTAPSTARVCEALGQGPHASGVRRALKTLKDAGLLTVKSRSRQGGQRWVVAHDAWKEKNVDELNKAAKAAADKRRGTVTVVHRKRQLREAAQAWIRQDFDTEETAFAALTPELVAGLALEGYALERGGLPVQHMNMGLFVSFAGDILAHCKAHDDANGGMDAHTSVLRLLRDFWRRDMFVGGIIDLPRMLERWQDALGYRDQWAARNADLASAGERKDWLTLDELIAAQPAPFATVADNRRSGVDERIRRDAIFVARAEKTMLAQPERLEQLVEHDVAKSNRKLLEQISVLEHELEHSQDLERIQEIQGQLERMDKVMQGRIDNSYKRMMKRLWAWYKANPDQMLELTDDERAETFKAVSP